MSADKRLRRKKRQKQRSKSYKLRKKLIKDLYLAPCYYCKKAFLVDDLTLEHIIPLCLSGTNDISNLTLACRPCNHSRGRDAWFHRRKLNKEYYAQHYPQYRNENRSCSLQNGGTSSV